MKTCTQILCFKKTHLQIVGIHVQNMQNASLFLLDAQKSQILKGRLQKNNFVIIIEKNVQISEPYSLSWVSITNSEL